MRVPLSSDGNDFTCQKPLVKFFTHMAVQVIGRCLRGEGPRVSGEEFENVLQRAVVTLESAGPRRAGVGAKEVRESPRRSS